MENAKPKGCWRSYSPTVGQYSRLVSLWLLLFLGLWWAPFANAQLSLFTHPPLNGGNGLAGTAGGTGVTFNIRALSSVFIDTIYIPTYGSLGGTSSAQIWIGPAVTAQPNIAAPAWTQMQPGFPVTVQNTSNTAPSSGFLWSPVVIPGGLLLNAGDLVGVFVGLTTGSSIAYTGTGSVPAGIDTFSNSFITIYTGIGTGFGGNLPSPNISVRQFTGGVSIRPASGLDSRLTDLTSPVALVVGLNTITARAQNAAADPITQLDFGYQFNANPPVLNPGVNINPALSPGQLFSHTFSAPITVPANGTYQLRVWATNANGLGADANSSNDTLTLSVCTGLSGPYSIGGSGASFPTIDAAVAALQQCGITEPVTFQINPGTYYGSHTIGDFPNPGNFMVTFTSATGNASDVILIQDTSAAGAINRSHFTINTSSRIKFQSLSFRRTMAPSVTGQGILVYSNATARGEVINCSLEELPQTISTFNNGIIYRGSNGLFSNNSFNGFYYAVWLDGPISNTFSAGNVVRTNSFSSNLFRSVYALNQSGALVLNNQFTGFIGTSSTGAAVWTANNIGTQISANQISGPMSGTGILINNPNMDTLSAANVNKVFNNVINGFQAPSITSTSMVLNAINITGGFSPAITIPRNPRDAIEVMHNTVVYNLNSTINSTTQAALYITGGTVSVPVWSRIVVRNNHFEVNPVSGNLPSNFRLFRLVDQSQLDSLQSSNNNYRMGGTTPPAIFRINTPGLNYNTVADWNAATGRDAGSVSIAANFLAPSLLRPTNTLLDNLGTPVSYVSTDIIGAARSLTAPDIGAYEFQSTLFAQISHSPLGAVTAATSSRIVVATITDTVGSIVAGTARVFYKKTSQNSWQVDSLPTVTGNDYSFTVSHAALGGVVVFDTIEYYIAVQSASGTVTTLPAGGNGLQLANLTLPFTRFTYLIFGTLNGTYRVGTSGPADYPSLTAAANFLNSSFITGPVTFLLIDSSYTNDTGESFPITVLDRPGSSEINTVTIRPDISRTDVVIEGTASTTNALLILRGAKYFHLNGSKDSTNSRNLTLRNNTNITNTATILLHSGALNPIHHIAIRNVNLVGSSSTVSSTFGIIATNGTITTTSSADSLKHILISNVAIRRAYYGIFLRGASSFTHDQIWVQNSIIGSTDTTEFVSFRGVEITNSLNVQVSGNEVFNLVSATATSQAAIELAASPGAIVERNRIWGIKNLNTSGWGAWGVNVLSGNGVRIVNNVIYDLRTLNYSNTSTSFNAFGIRLAGGTNHLVHYNSVYLYGNYDNVTTSGSAASAFLITGTAISADVRNNIFAIDFSSTTAASNFMAIWVPTAYNFANLTLNNNAYHVPAHPQNFVGKVGTVFNIGNHATLSDWRLVSSVGNANNDVGSVPPMGNSLPPFVSRTNLTIPTAATTLIESGGVVIAALGTPNTDFNGIVRPAGTGIAPDMGAYEFEGIVGLDLSPPSIDSVLVNPLASQCVATTRTITIVARDNPTGRGIDSVWVNYSIDSVMQPMILLTRTSGTALAGVWTGVLPAAPAAGLSLNATVVARDSVGNFSPVVNIGSFRDDYLEARASNDTTILAGDSVILRSVLGATASGFLGDPTLTAGTSCAGGFMMDMRAIGKGIFVRAFDLLPNEVGSQTVNVFYRIGTKEGFQVNQAAWIQEGSYVINPTDNGTPFTLNLSTGFTIPEGATVGVYLQYFSRYTIGTTNLVNADLAITDGEGMCTNWTICCAPREWIGRVYYGPSTTQSWRDMAGNVLQVGDTMVVRPLVTTSYVLVVADTVCSKSDTVTVTVIPRTQLSGVVRYANIMNTPMNNSIALLVDNVTGTLVASAITDAGGAFSFLGVPNGAYSLTATTNKPWGGVNATDALAISNYFIGSIPLNGLPLMAADVNTSNTVNSTDALLVARRFVGLIGSFAAGDWVFAPSNVVLGGGSAQVQDVYGLCYGDVNATYNPSGARMAPKLAIDWNGFAFLGSESMMVPVSLDGNRELGSLSAVFILPQGIEVRKVRAVKLNNGFFEFSQLGNELRIAWFSTSSLSVEQADVLFELELRAAVGFEGDIAVAELSEVTNGLAEAYASTVLRMPRIRSSQVANFGSRVYPNPAHEAAWVEYSVPDAGKVTIRVTDALGKVVYQQLEQPTDAGVHQLELQTQSLPAGAYHINVIYNHEGKISQEVLKLQLAK